MEQTTNEDSVRIIYRGVINLNSVYYNNWEIFEVSEEGKLLDEGWEIREGERERVKKRMEYEEQPLKKRRME